MLLKLRARNALYPLLALLASLSFFFISLLCIKQSFMPLLLAGWILLLTGFGYGKTCLIFVPAAILPSIISGAMTLGFSSYEQAFFNGLRMYVLAVSAIPMLGLDPLSLVRCLNSWNCPRWLTTGILISLRFGSVVRTEMRTVRMAMRLRGVNNIWSRPGLLYRSFIVPFVIRLLSLSDTLAMSLETRAFTMQERTSSRYKSPVFRKRDWAFALTYVLMLLAAAYIKVAEVRL